VPVKPEVLPSAQNVQREVQIFSSGVPFAWPGEYPDKENMLEKHNAHRYFIHTTFYSPPSSEHPHGLENTPTFSEEWKKYPAIQDSFREAMKNPEPVVMAQYRIRLPEQLTGNDLRIELSNGFYNYQSSHPDVAEWWVNSVSSFTKMRPESWQMPAEIALILYLSRTKTKIDPDKLASKDSIPQPITLANVAYYLVTSEHAIQKLPSPQMHLNTLFMSDPVNSKMGVFKEENFLWAISTIYAAFAQARIESQMLYPTRHTVVIHINHKGFDGEENAGTAIALAYMVGARAANVVLAAHTGTHMNQWKKAKELFSKVWPDGSSVSLTNALKNLYALKLRWED